MPREQVEIIEVGLRDGLQMVERVVPTMDKLRWLEEEAAAGVHHFEAASFVPPKLLPQMADAAEIVRLAKRMSGLTIAALVPNLKGAQAAMAAEVSAVTVPISASAAHSRANVRRSPDEMIEELHQIRELRDSSGSATRIEAGISTAFGCTIQGSVPEAEVLRLAEAALAAGADSVALADTVGFADPAQVRRLFTALVNIAEGRVGAAHFHDTRGLGLANVVAALDAGIRSFDASLGGLGGCPYAPGASGNIATEDLVFMLEAMGFDTGVDLDTLIAARSTLAQLLPDQTLHGKVAKAGSTSAYFQARNP